MFLEDVQIQNALASALATTPSNLGSHWDDIILQSHAEAYQDIVNYLTGRGFKIDQITAWDQGPQCERLHSLYYCIVNGGSRAPNLDPKLYDQTSKLQKMPALVIAGVWTKPSNTGDAPGLIQSGQFNTTGDVFVPFDPNDPNLGVPTRW